MAWKRWKDVWKLGMVDHTPWGYLQTITNKQDVSVAEVFVYEGKTDELDLIMASPRLHRACQMMVEAMDENPYSFDKLSEDEMIAEASLEIRKGARLFRSVCQKKRGNIQEGEGGMK
jgi:hypothetical protein